MGENAKEKKEKCFVIMPISDQGDYPAGHFTKVYEQVIKPAVEASGYEAYRVDENKICDTIINKIFDAIQECPMAICDLSNRNPNVLYELGLRQAYDKPVVMIQDDKTEKIFDVSGISTVQYKSARLYEDVIEARENITKAILSTKDGKVNSLAKIMKVSAADFSSVEISQDDKINVILDGIYSELRKMNSKDVKADKIEPHTNNVAEGYKHDISMLKNKCEAGIQNENVKKEELDDLYKLLDYYLNLIKSDDRISTFNQLSLINKIVSLQASLKTKLDNMN